MKKALALVLALCMMVPFFALAEDFDLVLNREVTVKDYEGAWVLVGAYLKDAGFLAVPENAATLEFKTQEEAYKLVDMAAYIHNDVLNLQGFLTFTYDKIDQEEPYKVTTSWDNFPDAEVAKDGEMFVEKGAAKTKIRDDDETLYFSVLTGADVDDEDMDLMNVIGINAAGQLILGYSEEHIESSKNADAEWEYVYIFAKAE